MVQRLVQVSSFTGVGAESPVAVVDGDEEGVGEDASGVGVGGGVFGRVSEVYWVFGVIASLGGSLDKPEIV